MAYSEYMAAGTAADNLEEALKRELGMEETSVKDIAEGKFAMVGSDFYISKSDAIIVGSLVRDIEATEYGPGEGKHYQIFVPSDKGGWRKTGSRERGPGFGDKVWRRNTKHGGIEISFASKPDATVLSALKKAGYRWSGKLGLWWAKETGKTRVIIGSLSLTHVDDVAA